MTQPRDLNNSWLPILIWSTGDNQLRGNQSSTRNIKTILEIPLFSLKYIILKSDKTFSASKYIKVSDVERNRLSILFPFILSTVDVENRNRILKKDQNK